ncbi:MAG: efflux RND transporter periplasmic adaptor subunit [Acidobacteria bacterium]|nr:efflux RND transporter periplasmic adaptor subunit [Acidobacteriota bacterium]
MQNHNYKFVAIACLLLSLVWFSGCSASKAAPPKLTAPAKVENAVKEADLATIKLTPEAEKRLGIETVAMELRDVPRTLDVNGEIVTPQGQTMMVAAPMAGTLRAVQNRTPTVGQAVQKGQTLFQLTPFLAPERDLRIQIERDIASLSERVAGIKQRKERAEILAQEKAGSVRAVEEAQAELAVAEAELKGARERLTRFDKGALNSDFSVAITAPLSGVIQKVSVSAGDAIAGGANLLEISNQATVWIRVPVYVGDLPQLVRGQSAHIRNLSSGEGTPIRMARPVNAPPTADVTAATADLYFALPNADGALRPGQRVGVTLALRSQEQSLVIPWSAVLHDVQGGAWVYENTVPQTFVRRPVEVKRVSGATAVLSRAPSPGAKIVTVGATELFGTEFGAGK